MEKSSKKYIHYIMTNTDTKLGIIYICEISKIDEFGRIITPNGIFTSLNREGELNTNIKFFTTLSRQTYKQYITRYPDVKYKIA